MTEEEIAAEVADFAPEPTVFRAVTDGEILGEYDTPLEMTCALQVRGAPVWYAEGEPV